MTVSTEISRSGPYAGAGSAGPFTVGFRFLAAEHLQVVRTDAAGVETVLVLSTDYSVAGVGNPTGSVTLTAPLPVGFQLTIIRDVPFTQEADYVQNDAFPAESHENALDKLTMITQQLSEQIDRSLSVKVSAPAGVSTDLPNPQAHTVLGWNDAEDALQNVSLVDIATSVTYGTSTADLFSGTGAQQVFQLSSNPGSVNNLDVSVGGVVQKPGIDYTWSSPTALTFTTPPPVGSQNILVRYNLALPQAFNPDLAIDDDVTKGAALVGWREQTVGRRLDSDIAAQGDVCLSTGPYWAVSSTTRTIFAGAGVTHRHFGGIARDVYGRIHLAHRRAPEHGTAGQGSIVYCYIDNEGAGTVSPEVVIAAGGGGRDLRDLSIGITPTGRLVIHWSDTPAVPVGTGPTYLKFSYSDDFGASWSTEQIYDTVAFDFVRAYGSMKVIPGGSNKQKYRLVKPGYKQIAVGTYRTALYYSDDNGTSWVEGVPIQQSAAAYNETEVAFLNAKVGFACSRANPPGLNWAVTQDGGATWSPYVGISWSTSNTVAPSLDVIRVDGLPYLLLGYVDRTVNAIRWRWERADRCMTSADTMANHLKQWSATDMINASGYQKPVIYPSGEMLYVEYKEYLTPGDPSSDLRLVYASPYDWIANESGSFTPTVRGLTTAGAATYDAQVGQFVKKGRLVTAFIRLDLASRGGMVGQVAIGGLPFTVRNSATNRAALQIALSTGHSIGANVGILGFAFENTKDVRMNMLTSTGISSLIDTSVTDNWVLNASITYETDE